MPRDTITPICSTESLLCREKAPDQLAINSATKEDLKRISTQFLPFDAQGMGARNHAALDTIKREVAKSLLADILDRDGIEQLNSFLAAHLSNDAGAAEDLAGEMAVMASRLWDAA